MHSYSISEIARVSGCTRHEVRTLATFCGIRLERVGPTLVVYEPEAERLRAILGRYRERAVSSGLDRVVPGTCDPRSVPSPAIR
jgi:hypothetical protein